MSLQFYFSQRELRRLWEDRKYSFSSPPHLLANDPLLANFFRAHLPMQNGEIILGQVILTLPHRHWYRVALANQKGELGCCRMTDHSSQIFGLRDAGTIVPGSLVLIYTNPTLPFGVILGVIPEPRPSVAENYSDWISQHTEVGFFREPYYAPMLRQLTDQGKTLNFAQHRPVDSLAVGEWAKFNELGGGFFLDPFQAFLRMDETCGLWLFFLDRLLRLSGYNLDLRTAASELVSRMEEREAYWFQGWTAYLWEAMGFVRPQAANRQKTDQLVHPAQQPFWRVRHWHGYHGQGGFRQVVIPPQPVEGWSPDTDPWRMFPTGQESPSRPPVPIGVFQEHIGLDGSYQLASAHSIALEKRIRIAVPVARRVPEDPKGDGSQQGYSPTGIDGSHVPGTSDMDAAADTIGLALRDLQCQSQWKALHPFVYHQQDFHVPKGSEEESSWKLDHPETLEKLQQGPTADLPPQTQPLYVDHRQPEQRYYEGCSGIFLTPEGSVLIRDAWGGEIRLQGGNLYLSVPGNIYLQSGKNIVHLAGHDCLIRAKNSADISAGEHDVRIKAEKNLQLLARHGGLLLETQSSGDQQQYESLVGEEVQSSGIVLKAPQSPVIARSREFQVVTRDGQGITLDAGKQGSIRTVSQRFDRFLESMAVDVFPAESPQAAYVWTSGSASLPRQLLVGGTLFVGGQTSICGPVVITNGHISTDQGGPVGKNHPETIAAMRRSQSQLSQFQQQMVQQMNQAYTQAIQQMLYNPGKPGSSEFVRDVTFGFRSSAQMRAQNFRFPEAWWQTLLRKSGRGEVWRETPLNHPHLEGRLPFPGTAWQEASLLLAENLTLYDGHERRERDWDPSQYGTILRIAEVGVPAVPEQEYRVLGS